MLRIIANIIVLLVIVRLLRPVFAGLKRFFTGPAAPSRAENDETEESYSDLTPYEIEDADYEEIKRES